MTSGGKQAPAQNNDSVRWQIAQSLYELFAAAPNLQTGLQTALPRLLKALEAGASPRREFGAAIVVQETGQPRVQVAGQHNLPQAWAVLLAQPRSPLAPVFNRLLAHAETLDRRAIDALLAAETIPQPPLVLGLPLTFNDQIQGALLIAGADLTAEDRQALEQLAQPFGLALFEAQKDHLARRQARRFDALQKRIIRLSFDAQLEELHTDLVNG
ncbi:MAG TPA: hypothetical protein VLS48_05195, partial [Anaerolineales bacterium]|nr:hypothetical protein [Anaerolineales bacterium]